MPVISPANRRLKSSDKSCLNDWDLDAIIPLDYRLESSLENISPALKTNFCTLLSRDVYSEGDAKFLFDYLLSRQSELSPKLLRLLPLWLGDEQKHYQALRRVYRCISDLTFAEMDTQFKRRVPSLKPLQPILTDEFTIVTTLIFDEAGSMFSYRRDLREFYHPFGKQFSRIAQHLVQDEGSHCRHFIDIIKTDYQHRVAELPALLQTIVQLEKSLGHYHHTFLLDHAQEMHRFPPHFSQTVVQFILAQFGLGPMPPAQALKSLSDPSFVG